VSSPELSIAPPFWRNNGEAPPGSEWSFWEIVPPVFRDQERFFVLMRVDIFLRK
jgi:hypothetical protein